MRRFAALVAALAVTLAAGASAGGLDGKKSDARKGSSISTFKADFSS